MSNNAPAGTLENLAFLTFSVMLRHSFHGLHPPADRNPRNHTLHTSNRGIACVDSRPFCQRRKAGAAYKPGAFPGSLVATTPRHGNLSWRSRNWMRATITHGLRNTL